MKIGYRTPEAVVARTGGFGLQHVAAVVVILGAVIYNMLTAGVAGYIFASIVAVKLSYDIISMQYNERAFIIRKETKQFIVAQLRMNREISRVYHDLNLLARFEIEKHRINTTDQRIVAVMTDNTRIPLREHFTEASYEGEIKRLNGLLETFKRHS